MRTYAIIPFFALSLALTGCGHAHRPAPQAAVAPPTPQEETAVEREDLTQFYTWLAEFKADARRQGIRDDVLREAFDGVEPLTHVIELDRKQPEVTLTMEQYLARTVTRRRIEAGRELVEQYSGLLNEIASHYDVQPRYIVALWGMETNYGSNTGGYDVIPALATLAYDGRRSEFFRRELMKALEIAQAEGIDPQSMTGSWAGAMGQCQFMPSSFQKYAVDYDGDSKRDIWTNPADIFASIANYLHAEGWHGGQDLGVQSNPKSNFNVLLKWNRSRYFVTAVGQLADGIGEQ